MFLGIFALVACKYRRSASNALKIGSNFDKEAYGDEKLYSLNPSEGSTIQHFASTTHYDLLNKGINHANSKIIFLQPVGNPSDPYFNQSNSQSYILREANVPMDLMQNTSAYPIADSDFFPSFSIEQQKIQLNNILFNNSDNSTRTANYNPVLSSTFETTVTESPNLTNSNSSKKEACSFSNDVQNMYHEITETINSKANNQNLKFQNKNIQIAVDSQQKLFHGNDERKCKFSAEQPLVNCSNNNEALKNFDLGKENSLMNELFI